MRSIFISSDPKQIKRVFAPALTETLAKEAGLSSHIYSPEEVRSHPHDFADVTYLFSTWGMPVFEETEIRALFPALECVFYAAGTVQSFAQPFLHCGVKVFSAWKANAVPVAEYSVAQIILANKGFFATARLASNGKRAEADALFPHYPGNYECKVGIIGAGAIGSLVIQMLKTYRLDVMVFDPFLPPEKAEEWGVTLCSLDTLFASCQVVSNHLADNPQTVGMLNGALFERMLPYATFMNTGRGRQVVEEDLIRTLKARPDLTALLDLTYPEPPVENSPFYSLENCILTPHIAGSAGNEVHRMAEYMHEEYTRYRTGEPTLYEVTEEMLKTMA